MKFLKKNLSLIILIICIILLCIVKQELVRNLPILANAGAMEDDELMVAHALSIFEGNWLGQYKYNTIIKNVFFPICLAFSKMIGISYINVITLLYSIACIFFICVIRKKITNKLFLLITFGLLLFNPIMFSEEVMQRVYRNSLIPSLGLMTISAYIGMLLYSKENIWKFIIISIAGTVGFASFYYTREDSMWLIPYIVFMSLAIIISIIISFIKKQKWDKKEKCVLAFKVVFLFLPIISTFAFGKYISNKNYEYYQTKDICSQKNYSEVLNTIYAIKPNEKYYRVTNPKEKLDRMAEVSPSFAKIKPELDKMIVYFEDKESGEVQNGLFSWPFIIAIYNSGYDTPEKEKQIINDMNQELNSAMDEGLLERQNVMPILGGAALDKEGYKTWGKAFIEAVLFIGDYDNIKMSSPIKSSYYPGLNIYMNMFKKITGNRIIFDENAVDENNNPLIELEDQEQYIKSIEDEFYVLNCIKEIYRNVAIVLEIVGAISYVAITIYIFVNVFKRKYEFLSNWIILSGILGAIFTLLLGVSYVDITQTNAIVYLYLAGAYPLFISFSLISIYTICKLIFGIFKNNNQKCEGECE